MEFRPFRIGVISDTHGRIHPEVFRVFQGVDIILHAGDVGGRDVLMDQEALAPTLAVVGNVDPSIDPRVLPLSREMTTRAGRIAMTHGHLPQAPSTQPALMVKFFQDFRPDIVIYGHSHIPKLEEIEGVRVFNPGSAGDPRFGHGASVGLITAIAVDRVLVEHRALLGPFSGRVHSRRK